jgi:hypothetical protein
VDELTYRLLRTRQTLGTFDARRAKVAGLGSPLPVIALDLPTSWQMATAGADEFTARMFEAIKWNELIHRKPGAVDWPSPNLDVAYSEAWVAVDDSSCTIVSVPQIKDRYFTVQFLNGWARRSPTSTNASFRRSLMAISPSA